MILSLVSSKSTKDYYFISVSLPGFGGSSRSPDRNLDEFPNDIYQFLSQLGLEEHEIIIIGASFGSLNANALSCGVSHPLKIKQVQFLCPGAPGSAVSNAENVTVENFDSLFFRLMFTISGLLTYKFPRWTVRQHEGMIDCLNQTEEKMEDMYDDVERCGSFTIHGFVDNFKVMFNEMFSCHENELENNNVFFTFGKSDLICGEEQQQWYLDRYKPNEKFVRYHDEGHCHCVRHFEEDFLYGVSLL